MKITAVGDCAIQRNLPKYYQGFNEVKECIMQGEIRFYNLETTVCEDCYPGAQSGGTWLRTTVDVLKDSLEFGFNVMTPTNNHCLDFDRVGLEQTIKNIKDCGIPFCGSGRNLAEASAPTYLDTPSGRVAFIACTSSFPKGAEAGEQSRDLPGRPGINPLRFNQKICVDKKDLQVLKDIAQKTKLNLESDLHRKSGYLPPEKPDEFSFGSMQFVCGEPKVCNEIVKADMDRIITAIKDAKFQADVVMVSIHSHTIGANSLEEPADYLVEFAHNCIDAGAHAVIGHGPHIIRPVEIYKGLPIFYSLGDFVLQLENCKILPHDFCSKFGLRPEDGIYEVFKARTNNFTKGLQYQKDKMEAVIPYFEIENGKLTKLKFTPIELGFGMKHSQIGWPRIAKDNQIINRLAKMSAPYGTKILDDGTVVL